LGKISRSVAPLCCTLFMTSANGNFNRAMILCWMLQFGIVIAKSRLPFWILEKKKEEWKPSKALTFLQGSNEAHVAKPPVSSSVVSMWKGMFLLASSRTLLLLTLNTVVTNMFVYPMNSLVFPMVFKRLSSSVVIDNVVTSLGMRKEKAWMNFTSLISFAGVFGPIMSTMLVHCWSWGKHANVDPLGNVKTAMTMQIGSSICIVISILVVNDTLYTVGLLFLLWSVLMCSNNIFTIYLSSISPLVTPL